MARDHDGDRGAADDGRDGAHDVEPADGFGELRVADRRAVGDLQQALPDRHLERTAGDVELELERSPFAVEVLLELLGGRLEQRRLVILRAELQVAAGKGYSRQSEVARDRRERADRALVDVPEASHATPSRCSRAAFVSG